MANIDVKRSAVLVMDYQKGIVSSFAKNDGHTERAARVLEGARKAGIMVIYAAVGFREGFPEIGPRSSFRGVRDSGGRFLAGDSGQIHPLVAPKPGEVIVTKKRVSAFAGSDLDLILRSYDIEYLTLLGIATSGVVLSTLRQARDMDYKANVIADACSDPDDEVHRVLCQKVFPPQARVMTADAFLASLA